MSSWAAKRTCEIHRRRRQSHLSGDRLHAGLHEREGWRGSATGSTLTGSLPTLTQVWNSYGIEVGVSSAGAMVGPQRARLHHRRQWPHPGRARRGTGLRRIGPVAFTQLLTSQVEQGPASMKTSFTAPASDAGAQKRGGLAPIALVDASVLPHQPGRARRLPQHRSPVSATTTAGSWVSVRWGSERSAQTRSGKLFYRPLGSSSWTLVTPQGVADNGGLVARYDIGVGHRRLRAEPGPQAVALAASSNGVRPGTRVSSPRSWRRRPDAPRRQPVD